MNKKRVAKQIPKIKIPKEKIIDAAILKLQEPGFSDLESANILSEFLFFDIAKKILDINIKKYEQNPIEFIEAISKYLHKKNTTLIEKNEISTHDLIIKETKQYIKTIKKSLKIISDNLDKTYLLYKRENRFHITDNIRLINSLEELSQTLSLTNNHSQAESCFDIKSKIELGVERYFVQKEEILKYFDDNGNFEFCDEITLLKIDEYFNINPKIKNVPTQNFIKILIYLKHLKRYSTNKYEKELSKYLDVIEFFPEYIRKREEYLKYSSIAKSINKNFSEKTMEFLKQKIIIINPYNIKTINKTLELLK